MSIYIEGMNIPTDRSRWVVIYPDGKVEYSDKTDEWETLDKGAINAIDMRPVMRARWITHPTNKYYAHMIDYYECPLCGFIEDYLANFCPNCGADMRETPKEE